MPAADSAALLVARFLKSHHYTQSYQAFIAEASLPDDAGDVSTTTTLTLERLLEEKRLFDQSVNFEKLSLTDTSQHGWGPDAPTSPSVIGVLPSKANVLNVLYDQDVLFVSTSDRRIHLLDMPQQTLKTSWTAVQDSPVLAQMVVTNYHISASMSGSVVVVDIKTGEVIERRKDHAKYVVALASISSALDSLVASAGWDNVINIYRLNTNDATAGLLGAPATQISLQTKPESIVFSKHPESGEPILVVSRTDSSHLHFYSVSSNAVLLGRQNLAPHSNAWVAFTPSSLALHPKDSSIIAVATNSTPHMKLIVAQLLFPTSDKLLVTPQTARDENLAQQAIADKEHEAITLHCNTMSVQTPYSSPLVIWRPNGQGVWVNGDDGLIRGIDVQTGKVAAQLQCHEAGTKVRTIYTTATTQREQLISGGFDQRLVLWTSEAI